MSFEILLYAEVRRDGRWQLAEPTVEHERLGDRDTWPHGWRPAPVLVFGPREIAGAIRGGHVRGVIGEITRGLPERALPDDLCEELTEWAPYWGANDSWEAGWFTLAEWAAIDWDTPVRFHGEMDRLAFRLFTRDPGPVAVRGIDSRVRYRRRAGQLRRWLEKARRVRQMRKEFPRPPRSLGRVTRPSKLRALAHSLRYREVEWAGTRRDLGYPLERQMPRLAEYGAPEVVRVVWWWGE